MRKYWIRGVFGLTGSGKTTLLARAAAKHIKSGGKVYSNFPLKGCYRLDIEKLGDFVPPENSLLLIDEISMICDCRQWKYFDSNLQYFFTHHRKHKCSIFWASQSFGDADKKIRNLTDKLYHCYSWHFGLCSAYPVEKFQRLEHFAYQEGYEESCLPLLYSPKKWGKLFDTDYKRELPPLDCSLW